MNGNLFLALCLSSLQRPISGGLPGVAVDGSCTVAADCATPGNVCENGACKIGVAGDCSSDTSSCVTNAGCISNVCDCNTNYATSGLGCVEKLNCYSCSSGCDKDASAGSTEIRTSNSEDCTYCYIAWNDQGAARGCLTATTATSNSISSSGCSEGWTEGLTGTGCACETALCNDTPTTAGYIQSAASPLYASAVTVAMASILLHHLF
ncbi:pro-epidermal growth factor-like isoform X1 [Mya arenaria]|uniref:pro-epidermal growth factor-like isoform X1 n=1 Tax=Mya arenaria TaxID=6604 RepID=UPI0022E6259F|nr:pro-epidermal growth factor-like isoform X1 [Mya arenaria]XP_052771575.1 pro-epidermal growth factor-like isoform X1 [Mya arenaria]XP_052771576.1 pro-epidermal growth factor-like isoform X1 [Mya arenaria]